MNRIACVSLAAVTLLTASPSLAVTNQDGQVLITQAAVNAGNVTPGDTPGFPATISVPGSYRLASNLTVPTAANGNERCALSAPRPPPWPSEPIMLMAPMSCSTSSARIVSARARP